MAPVNGFGSANFMDMAICAVGTSCSGCRNGLGTPYDYSAGIIVILYWIMAVSCIQALIQAIFLIRMNK